MKAVVIIEWDLDDFDNTPLDWHTQIQQIMDAMPKDGMRPASCGLAIKEKAEAILSAYHGVSPLLNMAVDTVQRATGRLDT